MTDPIVGRSSGLNFSGSNPAGTIPQVSASSDLINNINAKLGLKGINISDSTEIQQINFIDSIKDKTQLATIAKYLKARGNTVKASAGDIKKIISSDSVLSNIAANSKTYTDFINALSEDYIPGLDTTTQTLPSRQINEYKPEVLNKFIDSVYQSGLGRKATDAERAARLAELQQQIGEGTVTTTKKVKNPTTGVMESVSTTTPGFSQEAAQAKMEEQFKQLNPDEFDRKKRIDFSSWISQNVAGA